MTLEQRKQTQKREPMDKPWDTIRKQEDRKPPIGNGEWFTGNNARVRVRFDIGGVLIDLGREYRKGNFFDTQSLGELIEFLTEVKEQLER